MGTAAPLVASFPPPPPPTGARLLLRLVRAAATLGSYLPQVSHKASAAITIWSPPSCDFPLLLPSSWKALARSKTLTKKGQYLDWHHEGDVASIFPWECWAWIPAFPRGGEATQNTTATYFFQTAPAKLFWDDQKADLSRYRHPLCPKCPNLLGQVGQSIGVFEFLWLIPALSNWASMRRNQKAGSSSS